MELSQEVVSTMGAVMNGAVDLRRAYLTAKRPISDFDPATRWIAEDEDFDEMIALLAEMIYLRKEALYLAVDKVWAWLNRLFENDLKTGKNLPWMIRRSAVLEEIRRTVLSEYPGSKFGYRASEVYKGIAIYFGTGRTIRIVREVAEFKNSKGEEKKSIIDLVSTALATNTDYDKRNVKTRGIVYKNVDGVSNTISEEEVLF